MWKYMLSCLLLLLTLSHAAAVDKTTLMRQDVAYCNVFEGQPTAPLTGVTIAARITALAGASCTLVLGGRPSELPGAWIVSSPLVIPSTITLLIPDGATIGGSGNITIPRLLASTLHDWYTGTGTLTIVQYLYSPQPVLLPAITCNGAGNQAAGINAAIAAIPASGALVLLPAGNCFTTQALSAIPANSRLAGYGQGVTILTVNTATATAITLSGDYSSVRNLTLEGIGRTTGIGIFVTNAGQFSSIEDMTILHQGTGIRNESAGTEIRNVRIEHGVHDGILLNGEVRAQDELRLLNVQTNFNGGDGIRLVGGPANAAGAGLRFDKLTSVANGGKGLVSIPGSSGWSAAAVWVTDAEIGQNSVNLDVQNGLNSLFWTIHGGLFELAKNWNILLSGSNHVLSGAIITGAGVTTPGNGNGIVIEGLEIAITNNIILGNLNAGIVFGATSQNAIISNNVIKGNGMGLRFDTGATAVIIGSSTVVSNTALYNGVIPTGSIIAGTKGFDNLLQGAVQTSAPGGGTAKLWKLGAAAAVSPTAPNRTIEVEVDGVTLYISAKTTNN